MVGVDGSCAGDAGDATRRRVGPGRPEGRGTGHTLAGTARAVTQRAIGAGATGASPTGRSAPPVHGGQGAQAAATTRAGAPRTVEVRTMICSMARLLPDVVEPQVRAPWLPPSTEFRDPVAGAP